MSRLAAAVVTHNGQPWVLECVESILGQSRPPDVIVVVDDHSTDGTVEMLHDRYADTITLLTADESVQRLAMHERIATNFTTAVHAAVAQGADLVALGDQDDRWLHNRLEAQEAMMHNRAMVASDGWLVDRSGVRNGLSLRDGFPVSADFQSWSSVEQLRYAMRHSVATGGASMIRPSAFPSLHVPAGWLHDRWWSLAAIALGSLSVDRSCVIEYRVSPDQVVGLTKGSQGAGRVTRIRQQVGRGSALPRLRALRTLRTWPGVEPGVQHLLQWPNLIGSALRQ